MSSNFIWQNITLSAINFQSPWNLHPWCGDLIPRRLENSFEEAGILHPPLLLSTPTGYTILSGRRRLLYAVKKEYTELCCALVSNTLQNEELLHLVLEEQQCSGELTLSEKGRALYLARRHGGETSADILLTTFGVREHSAEATMLRRLPEMEPSFLDAIHSGRLTPQLCAEFIQLSPSTRTRLQELFVKELALGGGKQRRLFHQLRDLAGREGITIEQLLLEPEITSILETDHQNTPLKNRQLSEWLGMRLFPKSQAQEKRFRQEVQELPLPAGVELQHTPAFETEEVSLRLRFPSLDACKAWLTKGIPELREP